MALGILLIVFIVIVLLAVGGLLLLYVAKNKKVNTAALVFLAILGFLVAYLSATSGPSNYVLEKLTAVTWGALAVVGLMVRFGRPNKSPLVAKLLITASVVLGIAQLFWL